MGQTLASRILDGNVCTLPIVDAEHTPSGRLGQRNI
jgi:hypothetical protein